MSANLKLSQISDVTDIDIANEVLAAFLSTGRMSADQLEFAITQEGIPELIFAVKDALAGKGFREFQIIVEEL